MSARDKKLLIMLIGIGLMALSYFFVYRKSMEQADLIKAENAQLAVRLEDLQQLAERCPEYEREMERMNGEISVIIDKFPSYLLVENGIMDVVKIEAATNSFVSTFTVGDPTYIDLGTGQTQMVTEVNENGETVQVPASSGTPASNYQLYDVVTSTMFTVDYGGLKAMVTEIAESEAPMSVEFVNLSFDSSQGLLTGSMEYNSYFLIGQDKDYEEADIPEIPHGTDNIFGTINLAIPE